MEAEMGYELPLVGFRGVCAPMLDNTVLSKCQGIDNEARITRESTSNRIHSR